MDNNEKINIIVSCIMCAGLERETKQELIKFMREIEEASK